MTPASSTSSVPADLYERDEVAWLDEMCALLRAGRMQELDVANLLEYLESMAKRERREIESRLRVLLAHFLKWHYQPDKRTKSWKVTSLNKQYELRDELTDTLRKHAENVLDRAYTGAVRLAAADTGLAPSYFPADCPWTFDQVLTHELD